MKRTIRLRATDGETKIQIEARIDTGTNTLSAHEVRLMRRELTERLMLVLPDLRFTGIGLSDVKQ